MDDEADRVRLTKLLCALGTAILLFAAIVHLQDGADAARLHEKQGLARGEFLDRHGLPLTSNSGRGNLSYRLPSLVNSIGFRDAAGRWHGLEAKYESLLDATTARKDWRTFFLHLAGQSAQGASVGTTLDSRLQAVADRALGRSKGAVVAIQPQTGDVLAYLSKPYCSPRLLQKVDAYRACAASASRPMTDRAAQLLLPPGSAFKIVTLSAAIDSARFRLSDVFRGADAFGPSPYFDNLAYPSNVTRTDLSQLTLSQALAFSDNFTFAHIGVTLGQNTFLKYAHRYGLGEAIPFDLPVRPSVVGDGKTRLTTGELARSSFGAEDDEVTPLQMAVIAATVANQGVMMAPHLVASIKDPTGNTVWSYRDHALRRVMSAASARTVTRGMSFVVNRGSGYLARIRGVQVAGKTGTAASGGYYPHAWFIAFAPARHPVIAVAVLNEFSGEGFKYAAPIARKVIVAALRERGLAVR
ncbi:MAG TPA: hypothetical protein DEV93_03050 [Chloroflexi bacterium]|jgi:peptidoglycan glycosyltransferase|nr:hypothetical protein [Chloroflexota bacterium]